MKLWSDSWSNGDRIDARHAAGKLDGASGVGFADHLNPHLPPILTQLAEAIAGHVLEAATHSGTDTLNRRWLG